MAAGANPELYRQLQKLEASDSAASDNFGYAVAISSDGNTCAIGSEQDDNSGGTDAGSVYIWTRSGGTWTQQQRVQASDAAAGDRFGTSVALSSDGNTCAIGSEQDDNSGGTDASSVYIWTRSGGTWTQQQRLQASDAAGSDRFGVSVALSSDGNTCSIGAHNDDNSGGTDAGSVYIWTRSGGTWTQQQRLQASDAAAGDFFGYVVALSSDGNTCAIGAYLDNNSGGTDAGSVYIWTRSGGTWTQQQRLQASDAAGADSFGFQVSLSSDGNTCAIGAHRDDNSGGNNAGSVYIWTRSGGTWTQQQRLQASDAAASENFGSSVALSSDGNTCAIAAVFGGNSNAGSVYIWTRSGGTWTEQQQLQASDGAASHQFGYSLSISNDAHTVAIGSRQGGVSAAGAAYIFLW